MLIPKIICDVCTLNLVVILYSICLSLSSYSTSMSKKTKKKKKNLKNTLTFLSLLDTSTEHKTPSSICFISLSKPKNLETLTPSTSWSQSEKFKSLQVWIKCEKLQQWLMRNYHLQPHLSKVISRPQLVNLPKTISRWLGFLNAD